MRKWSTLQPWNNPMTKRPKEKNTGKRERRRAERPQDLGGVRKKLEEEKRKEARGVIKLRKQIQEMKRLLSGGAGGVFRPVYKEY